jgi:site-specific recombinase XerD
MAGHGGCAVSARLRQLVGDYLRIRRALGYQLQGTERLLFGFVDYLQERGSDIVSIEHALGFATAPVGASPRWQALRLSAVRCFARWAHTLDPQIQIPPARLMPARVSRAAPYIYTSEQIAALLAEAEQLRSPMRARTYHTLIALMAATGIRTGEAIGLDITDFDTQTGTLTVTGKYGKTRMLPLHPTVTEALTGYLRERVRLLPTTSSAALLVSTRGTRLLHQVVHLTFRSVANRAGLVAASSASRPRLHDLRHTFAVATMLDAYRSGDDPATVLPVLATWLGHVDPNDTYWYLTGTAELLAAANERLQTLDNAPLEGGRP